MLTLEEQNELLVENRRIRKALETRLADLEEGEVMGLRSQVWIEWSQKLYKNYC